MSPNTFELVVHKIITILNCNYESYKMFVIESLYFLYVSIDLKVVTWSQNVVVPAVVSQPRVPLTVLGSTCRQTELPLWWASPWQGSVTCLSLPCGIFTVASREVITSLASVSLCPYPVLAWHIATPPWQRLSCFLPRGDTASLSLSAAPHLPYARLAHV